MKDKIKKLYASGAFHITIGSFVTKFVAFFGSIFVVRLLTKTDYGILQYVENLYSYALVLAGFGLPFAILRYVVIAEKDKKSAYLNYTVWHSFLRDCVIACIIILVNFFIKYPENFQDAKIYIPILAVLLPFQDLVTNGSYALRAVFRNKEYAYAACIVSILLILGRIFGAKVFGLAGVVWSRLLINFICASILIIIIYRIYPRKNEASLSKKEINEMNKYSFQYMISSGLWAIFMLNDTFLLSALTNDPTMVAEYKVAYVLPGNLSLISTAIGIYVAPYFTKNENNKEWVRKNYRITSLVNAGAIGAIAVVLMLFAGPLIKFIYGDSYLNVVPLMRVLLFSAFINSGFRYVTANILSAMGKVRSNLIISIVGVILQIILDLILIPTFGAMGVAYSNCIVFIGMAISLYFVYYKTYNSKKSAA